MSEAEKRAPMGTICASREGGQPRPNLKVETRRGAHILQPAIPRHFHVGETVQQVGEAQHKTGADGRVGEVDSREEDGAARGPRVSGGVEKWEPR